MNKLQDTVEPKAGQVYENARRGELYQLLYVDTQVVLLRSEDSGHNGNTGHRIEQRVDFDNQVEHSFFEYKPESKLDLLSATEQDWTEVAYIGEQTTENLYDAGFKTCIDVRQATDSELSAVDGVGTAGRNNLQDYCQ